MAQEGAPAPTLADLLPRLIEFYGPIPQPPPDAFGIYVWEVLGTRTTAGRRDQALQALKRIPAFTPDSMRKVGRGRLEAIVRLCGPFVDERLSALDTGLDVFRRQRDFTERLQGSLKDAWLAVGDLPHLGEAGGVQLLLFASPHMLVPVDAAMARLSVRLGVVEASSNPRRLVRTVRRMLGRALPSAPAERRQAAVYLAHHAHATCVEVDPHCAICPIVKICPHGLTLRPR